MWTRRRLRLANHRTARTRRRAERGRIPAGRATAAVVRERTVSQWSAVEVGPGGRWVYASTHENGRIGIIRWNPLTGESLPQFGGSGSDTFQIAVSADERCVVASIYNAVRVLK